MSALFGALLVFCTIYSGEALSCFQCSSHNLSACASDILPEFTKVVCSTKKDGPQHATCLKVVQSIDSDTNRLKPERRVIRSCGWVDNEKELKCNYQSLSEVKQVACSCNSDYCNSSQRNFVGYGVLVMFLLARFVL